MRSVTEERALPDAAQARRSERALLRRLAGDGHQLRAPCREIIGVGAGAVEWIGQQRRCAERAAPIGRRHTDVVKRSIREARPGVTVGAALALKRSRAFELGVRQLHIARHPLVEARVRTEELPLVSLDDFAHIREDALHIVLQRRGIRAHASSPGAALGGAAERIRQRSENGLRIRRDKPRTHGAPLPCASVRSPSDSRWP